MKSSVIVTIILMVFSVGIFLLGVAVGRYRLPPFDLLQSAQDGFVVWFATTPIPDNTPEAQANTASDEEISPAEVQSLALDKIVALIETKNFATQTERIDFIREYINNNSVHKGKGVPAEGDVATTLTMINEHAANNGKLPEQLCSGRALAMIAILERLEIPHKYVHIYSDEFDTMRSHSFVEVYNTDSGAWEVQDPDYNVFWVNMKTGKRLSLAQLLLLPLDGVQAQSSSAVNEIERLKKDGIREKYFEAAVFRRGNQDTTLVLINTDRFSIEKIRQYSGMDDHVGYTWFYGKMRENYSGPIYFLEQREYR